jgi:nucleotide-binding universal stress UspA family protein
MPAVFSKKLAVVRAETQANARTRRLPKLFAWSLEGSIMLPFYKILVPTDFTEYSIRAFHIAAALARDHGAKLLVLHVREVPIAPFAPYGSVPAPNSEAQTVLEDKLEQFRLLDQTITIEYMLVEGAPAEEIVKAATARQCDLIVMGSHGRNALASLVMGSVALEVSRKAPCPVLTVKHPLQSAEAMQPTTSVTSDPQ